MGHKHDVIDKDKLFKIDPVTREILNNSSKTTVVQYDHNSERFTFELPRIVDGHDMSLCNKVEVHYFNIDDATKKVNSGIYEVHDLKAEGETATCSWLISGNSTQLKGLLKFLVRYKCVEDDVTTYAWNTLFFTGLYVSDGSDADQIFETEYVDVIEQWKASVMETLRAEIVEWEEAKAKELQGNLSAWTESEQAEIRRLFGDYESYWQKQIDVERSRIDNFTKLAEGSTTGDAELQDIRIGASGKTYDNAGTAVREEEKKLYDDIRSSFVETGYANKYISACKVFTDEFEQIMISDIRRNYNGETGFRIYSSDETGKSFTYLTTVVLPLEFEAGTIEQRFGDNSLLNCYVDLTSLDIGGRLTGDGKPFLLKRECILPMDFISDIDVNKLKNALFSACNTDPKKILTWIDDDTPLSGIVSVKAICDNLGIKCTFATITQNWTEALLEILHQYQKEGFHITSHTESHGRWYKDMPEGDMFDAIELESDLLTSLEKMRMEGFNDCDMLVYPGNASGRNDVNTIDIVKKWCRCGVLAGGANWSKYGQGKYKINRTFIAKSSYDASYYKNILDSVTDESWVVFGTHSGSATDFDQDMMTEIFSYALESGWAIMPLNEALKYREKYYHIQEILGL